MAQPTPYVRQYNFTTWQAANPLLPLPAIKVDLEYNTLKITLDQILTNLKAIQRDDTQLANNSVSLAQLAPEVLVAVGSNVATAWATATAYKAKAFVWQSNALYVCNADHTSGVFATDLAAVRWTLATNYNTPLTQAQASATAAANSQIAAAASEANAALSETNADASAVAAAASASEAASFFGSLILPLPVSLGGHGASTAAQARTNLGVPASSVQVLAGTGLTGGGTLAADRTLALANTPVTPGTYGSASQAVSITVDAQGRLTAASNVAIPVVADTENLVLDPFFDNSAYWDLTSQVAYSTASAITANLNARRGVAFSGAGATSGGTSSAAQALAGALFSPIEPNTQVRFYLAMRVLTGFTGRLRVRAAWYDQANAFISNTDSAAIADYRTVAAASDVTQAIDELLTAPATARYVRLILLCDWSSTLSNAGLAYAANPRVQGAIATTDLADLAVTAGKIAAQAVTYAKIQNVTSARLLGRNTAGAGVVEEIDVNALTEDTAPDANADFVLSYDASATGFKKVKYRNVKPLETFVIAASDEITSLTTGTGKTFFRMPYAFTVTAVRAMVNTVSSSGIPSCDIMENGVSILSTKLTIDVSEKTSATAAVAAVISDTSLADDAEIRIDILVAGTGTKGLKVAITGYKT